MLLCGGLGGPGGRWMPVQVLVNAVVPSSSGPLRELEAGPGGVSRVPSLSRGEVELLLPVVTGRPKHLHEQVALLGHARAGGPHGVPGQHVLLLPAAGLVPRVVHASAPGPCVQPQQGRVHRGCQDHRGACFGV